MTPVTLSNGAALNSVFAIVNGGHFVTARFGVAPLGLRIHWVGFRDPGRWPEQAEGRPVGTRLMTPATMTMVSVSDRRSTGQLAPRVAPRRR